MPNWEPIEGETPIDPSGLIHPASINNRRQLAEAEAPNINKAVMKYLALKPTKRSARFDYPWFLKLHKEMLGDVWDWAGIIRSRDLTLGVPFYSITDRLSALVDDLNSWTEFGHPLLEQATWLHHRAVEIHPFANGNGRWARMLSNIWLKLNDEPIVIWPDKLIGESSVVRAEYLAAIRKSDQGNHTTLLKLHERFQQ